MFDTLNAKAAIFAVMRLAQERNIDLPIIVSATVSDNGGRLLSGQNVEAFCVSVLHANPLALGLNCSFGAEKLKPYIAALSAAAPCLAIAYPNAGLPDNKGMYEETPETMASRLEEYMAGGLVNIVGGCCGSTPAHIAAIAARAGKYAPRPVPAPTQKIMLAGLNAHEFSADLIPNPSGPDAEDAEENHREFNRLLKEGDYDGAVDLVRETVEEGAALIHVRIDDSLPDAPGIGPAAAIASFLNLALQYPDIARLPVMLDSPRWDVIEAGLKCLQGKGLVNSAGVKGSDAESLGRLALVRAYGAEAV